MNKNQPKSHRRSPLERIMNNNASKNQMLRNEKLNSDGEQYHHNDHRLFRYCFSTLYGIY